MFRSRSICMLGTLSALVACAPDDVIRVADVELRFSGAASCRPADPIDTVVVEALGDFAASDARTIEILRPSAEPGNIDRFPFDTAALLVRATTRSWEGVGVRYADGESTRGPMLLLPPGQDCALGDPALALGAASLLATPEGGAIVVSGAARQVLRLAPGETLAQRAEELERVRDGFAGALEGGTLVVAGGSEGAESYETFDAEGMRGAGGMLARPRREASALALGNGEVLILGGREGATVVSSVEVLNVEAGTSRLVAEMPVRRASMSLVRMDDGALVALGGVADGGNPVGDVVAYDLANDVWELLEGVRLPALPDTQGIPLPGARIAVIASSVPGRSSSIVRVLRRVPPMLAAIPALEYEDVTIADAPALSAVRGAALPDGRILVSGRDDTGGSRAFAFDVGRATAEELAMSDTPDAVVAMADGTVLSTSERGASMRRVVARTPFHQAPATFLADDFALDSAGRFETSGTMLRALVTDARADIATLSFTDVRVEFAYEGSVELLFRPEYAAPVRVAANATEVGPALCTLESGSGLVSVERRGDELVVRIGEREQRCRVEGLGERVGLGFRLSAGSTLSNVRAARE